MSTLIQGFLSGSIPAVYHFVAEVSKQDSSGDWMAGAESWKNCDEHPQDDIGKSVVEGEKNYCSCSLDCVCCSHQTRRNTATPRFVYRRRKLQRDSMDIFSAQPSTKITNCCHSALSSAISHDVPSAAGECCGVSADDVDVVAVRDNPDILPADCNSSALVSKSESFDGCPLGGKHPSEEASTRDMRRIVDACCVNDSCSSSKSNMDLGLPSLKVVVDETGECSSSGAIVTDAFPDGTSERDICISLIRNHGKLQRVRPEWLMEDIDVANDNCRSKTCKVCEQSETTVKMLICDICEEAFHVSCCNLIMKDIQEDEWFCDFCVKKKHKLLKGKSTVESASICNQIGRELKLVSGNELGAISLMLKDTEPFRSSVRIGADYQAEVPVSSAPSITELEFLGEPLEINGLEDVNMHECSFNKKSRLSSIGNWLQCREVIDDDGGGDEIICGKWRRAPLFEVQTDDWECFCSVLWDPTHADCAVPQEVDTEEVLKQLKYIEMLKPRLAAKRRKFDQINNGLQDLEEPRETTQL